MNPTLAQEFARMASEIDVSERGDLQNLLDYISSARMLSQGLGELPEVVAFLKAVGGKIGGAMHELRAMEALVKVEIGPAAGDEIGKIWGNPNLIKRGS